MKTTPLLVVGLLLTLAQPQSGLAQTPFRDFVNRVDGYMILREGAMRAAGRPAASGSWAEIRRGTDALAAAIVTAREGAAQGDIFSPEIAAAFRQAVREGCDDRFLELLGLVTEDLEAPLPAPAVHARWPIGAPLPTMPPDLLARLPILPRGLEYRFMNRALVLRDIDANLILDFVPDAIPALTGPSPERGTRRR